MWSSRSSYEMNWESAVSYCNNLTECGYSDWRLPTISELRTLIQNCSGTVTGGSCGVTDSCLSYSNCWSDSCYCDYYIENNGGYYSKLGDDDNVWLWSSSTSSVNADNAWRVGFDIGGVADNDKGDGNHVRCVR